VGGLLEMKTKDLIKIMKRKKIPQPIGKSCGAQAMESFVRYGIRRKGSKKLMTLRQIQKVSECFDNDCCRVWYDSIMLFDNKKAAFKMMVADDEDPKDSLFEVISVILLMIVCQ
jgi:hypothetical protein